MQQLSFLEFSTDINDYLVDVKQEDITINKKLSRSINSKGFYIVMYKKERLCYVKINKVNEFIGLHVRHSDDKTGIYTPCSPYEVSSLLDESFQKYIKLKGGEEE